MIMDPDLLAQIRSVQIPENVPTPPDHELADSIRSFKRTQTDWYNVFLLEHIATRIDQLVAER